LYGRRGECAVLAGLLTAVRGGQGAVLVLRGDAGAGKTALLDYAMESAAGLSAVRAAGVESEMELPFAGLHQLCGPMLDRLGRLPAPQRDALQTVFGIRPGPQPDRFMVSLGVLSLLSEAAGGCPLVCLIDDAQWLDQASAQALSFTAHRLRAEPVLMLFAEQGPGTHLAGLPELAVKGLPDADARDLLASVVRGPLDEQVRDRILAEARGNPLALLELPLGFSPAQLAGDFGLPDMLPLPRGIEDSFLQRIGQLPGEARLLLVIAAAEPVGDPALVWRAAGRLGVEPQAAMEASQAGLVDFGTRVRFRHPLVRSAAYRSASLQDRRDVHRALAEATDPQIDPDRRAWHRAKAASEPDEQVAAELERAADQAQARGGLAAAAAFLSRAAALTPDPARRARRALAAATAMVQAGSFDAALELLDIAEAGITDDSERARVDLVRAQLALAANPGSHVTPLLLNAARRLERIDVGVARATYLDAIHSAVFAGHLASPGAGVREVAKPLL